MAGFYPDVPAPRMAYDRDGTVVCNINFNVASSTPLTLAQVQAINNESTTSYSYTGSQGQSIAAAFIFPQNRDIAGYRISRSFAGQITTGALESSVDTTNGLDGTWVSVANPHTTTSAFDKITMRTIDAVAISTVKAIRFRYSSGGSGGQSIVHYMVHLYGAVSVGETPDRLRMWHPTLDEPLDDNTSADGAYFDWGDIQRNTTSDKTFRIKNTSATLTANGIVISQDTLTDTSPTVNSQFTFSDGGAFAASIDIGSLAPGTISPVITKRFARPSNATLSLWTSRTIADPTSWT